MTYIVGVSSMGASAIISDARTTRMEAGAILGENNALKTGILFPGWIFGRAASARHSREFVQAAQAALLPRNATFVTWSELEQFAEEYAFPQMSSDRFQVLLSTRSSGERQFFLLDSQDGFHRCDTGLITLGSGKKILDGFLNRELQPLLREVEGVPHEKPTKDELEAYLLCLLLTVLTQSFERSFLAKHRVGGVFSFVCQTDTEEHHQQPALYVLCDVREDRGEKYVYYWQYRVSLVRGALVVDKTTPPGQLRDHPMGLRRTEILLDTASLPPEEVARWTSAPLSEESIAKLDEELSHQPFYRFLGFGFTNPRYRKGYGFHLATGDDYLITRSEMKAEFQKMVIDVLSSRQNVAIHAV